VQRVCRVAVAAFPFLREEGRHWVERSGLPVPLPAFFLRLFVPFTSGMRVMARFSVWTGIMTAALSGFGIELLVEQTLRNRRRAVPLLVGGLSALVLFESWTKMPATSLKVRPVDRWLSEQPADTVVVELPVDEAVRPLQDFYKTVHERRTVFGPYDDSYTPPERYSRAAALEDFPGPKSLEALRGWRVTHVLVTPVEVKTWSDLERRIRETPALVPLKALDGVRVYGLTANETPIKGR